MYYHLSVGVACYNCRYPWKNPCIHTSMSCHLCQLMREWYCQHYTILLYCYYKTTQNNFNFKDSYGIHHTLEV